jgi:AraC-like DNA-binding protein
MDLDQLDAVVRIGAVTSILLLAWLLLREPHRIGVPAILFAPLALCLSGFVIGNTPASLLRPTGMPGTIAHDASGFTVIFLWWFCLSCFDKRFLPRGVILATGVAWAVIAAFDRGLFGAAFADKGLSRLLVPLGFGIVGHLVWCLLTERSGDLIEQRHDARIMVAVLLGGMLFIDLAADAIFGFAWRPMAFAMTQNVMILGFGLWLAGRLLTVRPDIFVLQTDAPATRPARVASSGDDELHRRLAALMQDKRIFLDPELTLAVFVDRMGAPERAVRKLINHELGYDHFRTFLNHHRLAEARRRLEDPRHADDKLIAIALDSGFASLASFNRVFRASEGCSPSQYRATALGGASPSVHPAEFDAAASF